MNGLDATAPEEARRDRKRRRTRDALIDAALELFEAKGYEHTAVHEITDAVDVAERTFFRYFASKEDVALHFVRREIDDFTTALAARPSKSAQAWQCAEPFGRALSGCWPIATRSTESRVHWWW